MAYGIVHHFPGGTKDRYQAPIAAAADRDRYRHPDALTGGPA